MPAPARFIASIWPGVASPVRSPKPKLGWSPKAVNGSRVGISVSWCRLLIHVATRSTKRHEEEPVNDLGSFLCLFVFIVATLLGHGDDRFDHACFGFGERFEH